MYQVIIVVHVLLGLGIIGLILMQQGKGADAGAAFGSGSSGSVFGAQGAASFLSRTTAILAASFFVTSLSLAILGSKQSKTVDLMETTEIAKPVTDVPVSGGHPTATDEPNFSADEKPTIVPAMPKSSDVDEKKTLEPKVKVIKEKSDKTHNSPKSDEKVEKVSEKK